MPSRCRGRKAKGKPTTGEDFALKWADPVNVALMMHMVQPFGVLLAATLSQRLNRAFFDDTFTGIHHLAWFDLSLLIPYFMQQLSAICC